MTVLEIAQYAERLYLDEVISNTETDFILAAVNDGQRLLSPSAFPEASTNIEATADTWCSLPSDCVRILEIRLDGQIYTADYETRSGKIRFSDAGTFTVYYKQLPALLTSTGQSPNLHEAYHTCLAKYLAGCWKTKDDDENQDGLRLQQRAIQDSHEITALLRSMARSERAYRPRVRVER